MNERTVISSSAPADKLPIVIRPARPDDAEDLIAFVQRLSGEPGIDLPFAPGEFTVTVEVERRLLDEYASARNSAIYIAEINGILVGALTCNGGHKLCTQHAVTLSISIHEDWRDCGIGTMLMTQAIAWAKATGGVTRIELSVSAHNARAIHLYAKFGFEIEGERRRAIYQDGQYIDELLMGLLFEV